MLTRREFLKFLATSPLAYLLNQENPYNLPKITTAIRSAQESSIFIDGKTRQVYELVLRDSNGSMGYTLQLMKDNMYFAIINHRKEHLLFDFGVNNSVDIYIKDTQLTADAIMNSIDDAVNAYKDRPFKNKNLVIVKDSNDEVNKIFKDELKEISSLLNI